MSVTSAQCIEFACESYGVSQDCLIGGGRVMEYVWPRWLAMRLCRFYLGMTLMQIAKALRCDHGTVINGLRKLDQAIETDNRIAADVTRIEVAFQRQTGLQPIIPNKSNGYRLSKYSPAQ